MSTISTTTITLFLLADFTVIGSVGRNCLSSRMEITVVAKDIERGGKILSNNSYSRKVWGIKMCLTWCMLSRESFLHIVDCAQLYEKEKVGFFLNICLCHYN